MTSGSEGEDMSGACPRAKHRLTSACDEEKGQPSFSPFSGVGCSCQPLSILALLLAASCAIVAKKEGRKLPEQQKFKGKEPLVASCSY